jgi:hypothetical protein
MFILCSVDKCENGLILSDFQLTRDRIHFSNVVSINYPFVNDDYCLDALLARFVGDFVKVSLLNHV